MVHQRLQARDDGKKENLVLVIGGIKAERTGEEIPGAYIDRAQNRYEAKQIEPCGQPTGEAVTEDGPPVIKPARRRIGRADLRHGEAEHARHRATDDPTDADGTAASPRGCLRQRIDAARENADDRK